LIKRTVSKSVLHEVEKRYEFNTTYWYTASINKFVHQLHQSDLAHTVKKRIIMQNCSDLIQWDKLGDLIKVEFEEDRAISIVI
jgi:NAD-dependent oxidoreductase involved in siderophore biosynthesis